MEITIFEINFSSIDTPDALTDLSGLILDEFMILYL